MQIIRLDSDDELEKYPITKDIKILCLCNLRDIIVIIDGLEAGGLREGYQNIDDKYEELSNMAQSLRNTLKELGIPYQDGFLQNSRKN
jgi:hypothetical protein